jgi:hypothetical protein
VDDDFEERAKQAGGTAGTVAGAMSGARLLGAVVPVPFVGRWSCVHENADLVRFLIEVAFRDGRAAGRSPSPGHTCR